MDLFLSDARLEVDDNKTNCILTDIKPDKDNDLLRMIKREDSHPQTILKLRPRNTFDYRVRYESQLALC